MKIDRLDPKIPLAPPTNERKTSSGTATAKGSDPAALVELSDTAAALSSADPEGTFDTAKVDRIAQAIRDGKFEVNPEAIADKLIANAQELLGRGRT